MHAAVAGKVAIAASVLGCGGHGTPHFSSYQQVHAGLVADLSDVGLEHLRRAPDHRVLGLLVRSEGVVVGEVVVADRRRRGGRPVRPFHTVW